MDDLGFDDGELTPAGEFVGLFLWGLPSLILLTGWLAGS